MGTTTSAAPGEGIRSLRVLAGMTLDEVAQEAGISAAYLSRVETGQATATPKWLGVVASVIATRLATAA